MMSPPAASAAASPALSPVEREIIELFVHLAGLISVPRSIAELYGVLFVTPEPLCTDDVRRRLRMSKGSASQGLKVLRALGAIRTVYIPGDRRRFFQAELNLRRLVSGFMRQQVSPTLAETADRLARIDSLLQRDGAEAHRDWLQSRLGDLRRWSGHSKDLVPLVETLVEP